ncbi:MAG: GNAT family N-acetyltransferase [Dehalococcoidia bacterium]
MGELQVIRIATAAEMDEALQVRRRVFVQEQGVDEAIEIDEHDGDPASVTSCIHVLARLDGSAVATGRLLLGEGPEHEAHIGRVAVLASQRRSGTGRAVMSALHDLARSLGYRGAALSAQSHAVGFYEGLGYVAQGDEYFEAGIPHREMHIRFV